MTDVGFSESPSGAKRNEGERRGLYDFTVTGIDGQSVDLSQFKGKVALVVNVASKCGFTSQYQGLEALYRRYKDRGFVVLGFPSNDFMGQEPGTDNEIAQFCKLKYDVTFPMFTKAPVKGEKKQPVYKFLTGDQSEAAGDNIDDDKEEEVLHGGEVKWNFEKFLVDQKGQVAGRWRSITGPSSSKISTRIEELLTKGS